MVCGPPLNATTKPFGYTGNAVATSRVHHHEEQFAHGARSEGVEG